MILRRSKLSQTVKVRVISQSLQKKVRSEKPLIKKKISNEFKLKLLILRDTMLQSKQRIVRRVLIIKITHRKNQESKTQIEPGWKMRNQKKQQNFIRINERRLLAQQIKRYIMDKQQEKVKLLEKGIRIMQILALLKLNDLTMRILLYLLCKKNLEANERKLFLNQRVILNYTGRTENQVRNRWYSLIQKAKKFKEKEISEELLIEKVISSIGMKIVNEESFYQSQGKDILSEDVLHKIRKCGKRKRHLITEETNKNEEENQKKADFRYQTQIIIQGESQYNTFPLNSKKNKLENDKFLEENEESQQINKIQEIKFNKRCIKQLEKYEKCCDYEKLFDKSFFTLQEFQNEVENICMTLELQEAVVDSAVEYENRQNQDNLNNLNQNS